ncbi:Ferrous-iron efflux pump FieF [uncultured Roseburia sp.]|uniref:Cation diffusion facilitator family transporter n=1 Tax=Brotonthovivens ammoniilytica TaxID=2981725 RepID=A0ABT2TMQ6_9FIRM|nr:cation diffusion facilitator family transporter [Brotonthovivens ammoniilytica]MCU6762946.1 cation diffusion facilitator family transporter [Brotonthovivens ammoniilytica]SCI94567.1 Ferrous-iron efflux pump FieF [uncultured Roseburia sp.]
MIKLLAKIFLKRQEAGSAGEREAYGILCGLVGICLNLLLSAGKFLAGTLSGSIAITADAFNNLSDAGSSLVTMVGFKLAGAKPDSKHPFGHGRIEYVSGLIVSAIILLMAFELLKTSVEKIIHPEEVDFSFAAILILAVSILVKLYMAFYNRRIGERIRSAAMRATSVDSFSDAAATGVVLVSAIVSKTAGIGIDGWCGAAVSIFIFYAGISAARETLNPLLGQPPEPEFVEEIERIVMEYKEIRGIHDLIVHDYGPGRVMVSLHAEVSAQGDILILHDVIDNAEQKIREKMKCEAVIHMDPVITRDPVALKLKQQVYELVRQIDEKMSIHDFRVVAGPTHTNLIFDVVVPFRYRMSDEEVEKIIEIKVKEQMGTEYTTVIQVDKSYTG